jgi:sporulation protein YlmC with PRC-barrel domain
MLEEITTLLGLHVYTNYGVYVGPITNLIVDLKKHNINSLFIEMSNENLVENGRSITIPYRWVQNVGDIVLLKYFPEHVELSDEQRRMFELEMEQLAAMPTEEMMQQ